MTNDRMAQGPRAEAAAEDQQNMSMIERRKAVRTASQLPSYVRVLSSDSYVDCTVLDLSDTGAKVSVARPVDRDATIELHIPAKGQVVSAVVVWSTGTQIGVAFLNVYSVEEAAAALLRFVTHGPG